MLFDASFGEYIGLLVRRDVHRRQRLPIALYTDLGGPILMVGRHPYVGLQGGHQKQKTATHGKKVLRKTSKTHPDILPVRFRVQKLPDANLGAEAEVLPADIGYSPALDVPHHLRVGP